MQLLFKCACAAAATALAAAAVRAAPFRPPAVPLVTTNPYLSIWSEADRLTDKPTVHWTNRDDRNPRNRHEHPLVSLIRVDGTTYRLMGTDPEDAPPLPQVSLKVTPTRTLYGFKNGAVAVSLTFMAGVLPDDLETFSRPVTYLTWTVRSVDGKPHSVQIYDSVSGLLTVNQKDEPVTWGSGAAGGLTLLRIGTEAQPVLGSSGDDHRINWGYAYAAASSAQSHSAMGAGPALIQGFRDTGRVTAAAGERKPRPANQDEPVVAFSFDLGRVAKAPVERRVMAAYDEVYSIQYFGVKLRPYWRRNGATPATMLTVADRAYPSLLKRCADFDARLTADATRLGGARYAQICALAYRQALAACGLAADPNKQPLFFTKENTSNGDIATVDVFFPMNPMLILLSPTLAKASLVSVLDYAASPRWRFPNAPHDLGTYPLARGTDDGGEGMPVEESGNMLILCNAIAQAEGNANFAARWWPKLTQWARYLEAYGLDPENQLCTDDFMGHLAHNANLSVKAILGLAAYGDLCRMRGDNVNAARYMKIARTDAQHWVKVADEGDHSLLAFDRPNTWSQKYNLVWDRILGLNIFPPEVARKEVAYYKSVMQPYGVPLDSRTKLTKADWSIWSATMAGSRTDFEVLVSPIYDYLNATTVRYPFADSYETDNIDSSGMHARPVVGGVFIKMLADRPTWLKWARRDKFRLGQYAPLPKKPVVAVAVPTAQNAPIMWRYTMERPPANWMAKDFDDSGWKEGPAGFGTDPPGFLSRTRWDTSDIWIRRQMTLPGKIGPNLQFFGYHDEDVDIYMNGVHAASEAGFVASYFPINILPAARKLLKPGAVVTIAAHCHQTEGGQGIDIGMANVLPAK
ncbi:MAG TPA: DUF4965 domain-containing protein [Armatimonadota bacterium]|jgi:hypothetical protein